MPVIGPSTQPVDGFWRRCRLDLNNKDGGVHDGDTIWIEIDLGYDVNTYKPLRCLGVNAPELGTKANPNPAGVAARSYTAGWLVSHQHDFSTAWPFMVHYDGWDKYSPRFDGILVCGQNHCWNDDLLSSGHAVPMAGGADGEAT